MTNYKDFPFTTNGVNFISRVYSDSPFLSTIERLPEGAFASLNIQALTELVGDASLLSHDELLIALTKINDGGTHAFILLDEGSN
jgi:hypothetical protein